MKLLVAVIAVSLAPALATGQTLYRCKDAKGVSSYQQTPCPTAAQEAGEVRYQRQADRPHWTPELQARRDYEAFLEQERQAAYSAAAAPPPPPRRSARSTNPMSADAEAMRRMEHLAGSREDRALLRAQQGNSPLVEQALQQARSAPPPPPDLAPKQIRDQRGNTYTQPHGSTFARDNKTGKQCFVNGAFINC